MYAKEDFVKNCRDIFGKTAGNVVEIPGIGPVQLFDMPLIGFAAASDELFESYRESTVIGHHFLGPFEWLPAARTVVSFFFPASDAVRGSNRLTGQEPSAQWLYARIEGQAFINHYMKDLQSFLAGKGLQVCVPGLDARFHVQFEPAKAGDRPDFHADSRWSERHAAYACGLGTFGLSRGLITVKGMAGRLASLIISETWEPSERGYTGIDDYCVKCGACIRNCPVQAISFEYGKNNVLCKAFLDRVKEKNSPRYGCGKCQVGVPCECRAPGLIKEKSRRQGGIQMELMDLMRKRRSIRKYTSDEIPPEKLDQILQAGLLAPSSRNQKPCQFFVIQDRETMAKLSKAKSMGAGPLLHCAAAIAVFADGMLADTWAEDCSIAMTFMMLMAQAQGIGNCWVQIHCRTDADGIDAEQNVRRILDVPGEFRIAGILALGIPAEEKRAYTPEDADWGKVHRS